MTPFLIGTACVAWTLFELGRIAARLPKAPPGKRGGNPLRGERRGPVAWDEKGRRIPVEDAERP